MLHRRLVLAASITLALTACAAPPDAGDDTGTPETPSGGGAAGSGGGGETGGTGGSATAGMAGHAGTSASGMGGAAGANAGSGGANGGAAGQGGSAGNAGTSGSAGTGGSAGKGGSSGMAGTGGKAGSAGTGGGGASGSAGNAGMGGSAGGAGGAGAGGAPAGDSCPGVPLMVGTSMVSVTGTTDGATNDVSPTCDPNTTSDVIYAITAQADGNLIVSVGGGLALDPVLFLTANCGDTTGIACANASGVGQTEMLDVPVTSGTTYYLVVDSDLTNTGGFTLTAQIIQPPPGATCPGQAVAVDTSTPVTVMNTTVLAQNDFAGVGTGACSAEPGQDVVYQVTPASDGVLLVNVTPDANLDVGVYATTTCGGSKDLACAENGFEGESESTALVVAANTPVWIVVDSRSTSETGTFTATFTLATEPPNDACGNAQPLMLVPGTPTVVTGSVAAALDDTSGSCGGSGGPDVFYSFTPAMNGFVTAQLTPSGSFDGVLYAFDSTCGSSSSEVACNDTYPFDGPDSIAFPVTAGKTYYVAVDTASSPGDFSLSVAFVPPPTNDACASAQTVPIDPGQTQSIAGVTLGAANDYYASCGGDLGADVVYAVTPSANGALTATVNGASSFDTVLYVYQGTCGVKGSIADCQDNSFGTGETTTLPVTAGTPVYVVVDGADKTGGAFTLDLSLLGSPTNDACAGAQAVSLDGGKVTVTGNTDAAADDYAGTCGGTAGADVVYAVTPSVSGMITATLNASWDTVLYVYSTTCGDASKIQDCQDTFGSGETSSWMGVAGTTYWVVVDGAGAPQHGDFSLDLDLAAPPANDTCASPKVVAVSPGTPISLKGDTTNANNDYGSTCGGGATGPDLVYVVTPTANGMLTIDLTADAMSGYDPVLYASDTTCGGTAIGDCRDATGPNSIETLVIPVTAGATYYVVADTFKGSAGTLSGSFTISFTLQ